MINNIDSYSDNKPRNALMDIFLQLVETKKKKKLSRKNKQFVRRV